MKKEELASLAKEKGFITQYFAYVSESFPELAWLFWLTECQKWLRETHKIVMNVYYELIDDSEIAYIYDITLYLKEGKDRKKDVWDFYEHYDSFDRKMMWWKTYEEALQEGIEQALKFINN